MSSQPAQLVHQVGDYNKSDRYCGGHVRPHRIKSINGITSLTEGLGIGANSEHVMETVSVPKMTSLHADIHASSSLMANDACHT